jgi:glycosyltransferase involved in cell wall biosynthesis
LNEKPLVSVVTPIYNGEKYLSEALESWCSQTYDHFEIILVDDGSSDRSIGIIQKFTDKDHRFKLIRQEHGGIAKATNRGIQEAQSNYIVLMDQDDIAAPNRLELTVNTFLDGAELIMGDYEIIDEVSQPVGRKITLPPFITTENILLEQLKRNYFLGSAMAFYYKKDFYFNPDSLGVTDYDITLKMLLRNYRFSYLPHVLIQYRVHENNTSANYDRLRQNVNNVLRIYDQDTLLNELRNKDYDEFNINLSLGICYLFQSLTCEAGQFLKEAMMQYSMSEGRKHDVDERTEAELFFYSSVYHFKRGDYVTALLHLVSLIEQKNNNPAVLNNMGVLLIHQGKNEEALKWFEKSLKLNRDYQDVIHNINAVNTNNVQTLKFTERLLRNTLTHTVNLRT